MHWGPRAIAYTDPSTGTEAGPTESPFVVWHNGSWLLFIGPRPHYVGTDVFVGDDPWHFEPDDTGGHVRAHAAEVVADKGELWVTHAGWAQGGVHLARLHIEA